MDNIPVGVIVIWSGLESNIPDGWALCDGTNGTPDLRGKFVLGKSVDHAIGSTGGSEEVTLTVGQMPRHSHFPVFLSETNQFSTSFSKSAENKRAQPTASGELVPTNHLNSYLESTGANEPHPNMPPYYTLCYIIKLSSGQSDDPSGYATSKYSVEEMDALLDKVAANL